jgi:hypothetical protein
MIRPTVWNYRPSTYTDNSDAIKTNTDITFITVSNEVVLIGCDRRWQGFFADLTTNGSYTGLSYHYYSGNSTWKRLSLIDTYTFSESKYQRWVIPNDWIKAHFTSTEPYTATPPDDEERYWVKISVSAVTTAAVIDKIRAIPFVEYAFADDVADYLQINKTFNESTRPTDLAVENEIRKAEDLIDYRTKKSWRFNVVSDEVLAPVLMDHNRYGIYPRHRNLYKVYSVKLWNGSSWATLTNGRNQEYFVNYELGMIYFTRLFNLPAAYGMTGRYFGWGFGEFKNSVQLDYVHGRDSEVDSEFFIVKDIAIMMTSRALLRHTDYSKYIASGTDKVPLESKIRSLSEEIEEKLDSLTGIFIT